MDKPKTEQVKKTHSALYVQAKLMQFHVFSKKNKVKSRSEKPTELITEKMNRKFDENKIPFHDEFIVSI